MTPTPTIPSGYFSWAGGECPVPGDSLVWAFFRHGSSHRHMLASSLDWRDVIAYNLDPHPTPPIDWQAKYEAAEAELAVATENYLSGTQEEVLYALNMREERDTALAELATLRAKAEKLAAALKPFATRCGHYEPPHEELADDTDLAHDCYATVGDLRAARAALAEWEKP